MSVQRQKQNKKSLHILGKLAGSLNALSEPLATRFAKHVFLSPRKYKLTAEDKLFLEEGAKIDLFTDTHVLEGRRWGNGPPVLLCHGWSGSIAQFKSIAESLLSDGYSVIGFNFQGHGKSSAKHPTLFDFAQAIKKAGEIYGPFSAVICHSLGALAASRIAAEQDLTEKLILIGSLPSAVDALGTFSQLTGISLNILESMRVDIEKTRGKAFAEFDHATIASKIDVPILVVHDKDDQWTSWKTTREWAEKSEGVELYSTEGLGHSRILLDPEVCAKIVDFVGPAKGDIRSQFLSEYAL